ncbi:Cuticle-degrading protease [Boothiomyces macroporosus]|uniref:Cuticle-degrading protease n=1 Tax=Boothiomyces macroporosus TaxID=261099 RepID=A0AAD5UC78_9FUNG|nr:Cuticle-degrading protease [Boothiomyces macroporosus]
MLDLTVLLLSPLALAQSPTATVNSTIVTTDVAIPAAVQGMCYKKNRPVPTTTIPPKPKPTAAPKPQTPQAPPPQAGISSFAQSCLDAHNRYRAQRGIPPLSWNSGSLLQHAVNWAITMFDDNSMFHSQTPGMGENIAMGSGMSCEQAVNMWMGEEASWDGGPVSGSNYGVIGHFTQVMWRDSKEVSCSAEGSFLVCNYYPQGNLLGHMPF